MHFIPFADQTINTLFSPAHWIIGGSFQHTSLASCTLCRVSARQNMGANSNSKCQLFVIRLLWDQGLTQFSKMRLGRAAVEQFAPI